VVGELATYFLEFLVKPIDMGSGLELNDFPGFLKKGASVECVVIDI
jgi:hypothetical protein